MSTIFYTAAAITGLVGLEYSRRKGLFGYNVLVVPNGYNYMYEYSHGLFCTRYFGRGEGGNPLGNDETSFRPVKVFRKNSDGMQTDITSSCKS